MGLSLAPMRCSKWWSVRENHKIVTVDRLRFGECARATTLNTKIIGARDKGDPSNEGLQVLQTNFVDALCFVRAPTL